MANESRTKSSGRAGLFVLVLLALGGASVSVVLLQKNRHLHERVAALTVKLEEAEARETNTKAAPPVVRGKVTFVGSDGKAQVSVGSDSGLVVGRSLAVQRDRVHVGDLRLSQVEGKIAVGQFTPAKRDLRIAVGDEVNTNAVDNK